MRHRQKGKIKTSVRFKKNILKRHTPALPVKNLFFSNRRALLLLLVFSAVFGSVLAQQPLPHYPDSLFTTYYHQKVAQFNVLPHTSGDIIFLGNSITDGGAWTELFHDKRIKNRGISGDRTTGVLNRLGNIVKGKPEKVFLMIGINDLARGVSADSVLRNIFKIVTFLHAYSPATAVYVQSLFPVNPAFGRFPHHVNKGAEVVYINRQLRQQADSLRYVYVDVYPALKDGAGHLRTPYTNDGLHLLGPGYMAWKHVLYPYVYGLSQRPSIIPKPQTLSWHKGKFPLFRDPVIVAESKNLQSEAGLLKNILAKKGIQTRIKGRDHRANVPVIELVLGEVAAPRYAEEAYSLVVDTNRVTITGNTPHGVFNGIQTLRQLMRDGVFIDGCEVKDWPAFSWRGYMVDVGRNYQTVEQLKQQIAVMARYKLNRFHFHLTENVAWRLQIKRYPQLTAAKTMTRNKGQYYTVAEMKELIAYCKDRFITLVPEIDMPGHSAAFERAMGVDMQSEKGLEIIKNILAEVDSTYEVPYIHIGADEVQFTNKNFIPEVVALLHKLGKQTIGWNPGGNYDKETIRQLWKSQSIEQPEEQQAAVKRVIDSRGMYLNHKDPLSGVLSIFYKQLCDVDHGGPRMLGGEICLWNDDRAKDQDDILLMNFAYPAMLAFAERSWRGGGYPQMTTAMGTDTSARYRAFADFEKRLLDQKETFFRHKPFPYVKQSDIRWKLFGPFNNEGDTAAAFWPELQTNSIVDSTATLIASGGTVWLRHFFTPAITGVLKNPEPNTTWYAYRRIYSPVDTTGYFWIGFYNPSRSHAVMTPEQGRWDWRGSKLWINDQIVPPPKWTYPGRHSKSQESPLVDEGYEYRPAAEVQLKKGWNTILVKAPVGSFKGMGWQHPVKWMFTVVQVKQNGL